VFGLNKRKQPEPVELPESMKAEDPVNYNSVLDKDYRKMTQSAEIYRDANKKVAKVIGVKDEPTTTIATKPDITDDDLDTLLSADPDAVKQAFITDDDHEAPKPKKAQASAKKVEVQG
jgi:hypothetical protein